MDLHRTAELAIALGADGLMYNRINLGAVNIRLAHELLPTPEMIEENLATLVALQHQYGLVVAISVVIEPCVVDVSKYPTLHFGWCPQAGPDAYFTVDPTGNVRICNHSPTILGNIKHNAFGDIYYRHPYVAAFRETWPNECADCAPELKAKCGGGCKAAAEQCYGTLTRVDPFVTLNHSH
jgi:radical SAM protein with 4Fe4S-binding SPASM domain